MAGAESLRRHLPRHHNDPQTRPSRAAHEHAQHKRAPTRHLRRVVSVPLLNKNGHRGREEQHRTADERAPDERDAHVRSSDDGVVEDRADGCGVVEDARADVCRQNVQAEADEYPEREGDNRDAREAETRREEAQIGTPVERRKFSPCSAEKTGLRGFRLFVGVRLDVVEASRTVEKRACGAGGWDRGIFHGGYSGAWGGMRLRGEGQHLDDCCGVGWK